MAEDVDKNCDDETADCRTQDAKENHVLILDGIHFFVVEPGGQQDKK